MCKIMFIYICEKLHATVAEEKKCVFKNQTLWQKKPESSQKGNLLYIQAEGNIFYKLL